MSSRKNGFEAAQWVPRLCAMPWTLLATAAFIFFALNVDFASALQWHDGQRLAQLALLAVVVLVIGFRGVSRGGLYATSFSLSFPVRAALLVAFALGLCSSLNAPLTRWAMLEWGMSWLLVVLTLSIAAECRLAGRHMDQKLVILFFATAMAYATSAGAVYVTMLMVAPVYGQLMDFRELYVGFSNVRFFGHLQTMVLPFLLLPAMWWGNTRGRSFLFWAVPVVWWMLMIGAGTRGTWGGIIVGAAVVACCGGIAGRQWIRWQIAGFLGGLACYALFVLIVPELLQLPTLYLHRNGEIMSLSLRDILWNKALAFTASHPLFGVGPMHFAYHLSDIGAHPHNVVLQWLAEWGIPAAVLLTGVCATGGIAYLQHVRSSEIAVENRTSMIRVALLAALAGAGAQSMVDGVFVMPVSQITLALLCGWAMALALEAKEAGNLPVFERGLFGILTLVAVIGVACGVAPEIGHIGDRERAYLSTKPPGTWLMPRFWAQGYIDR
jgi:O-antigen ligase